MKIKFILIFGVLICLAHISHGQDKIKITQLNDQQLVKILNNVESETKFFDEFLMIRFYRLDNGTGSAGFPNSEVTHNYFIAVSEMDENPKQNLFEVGPFYNSTIHFHSTNNDVKEFEIEFGAIDNLKVAKFKISISELKLEK